MESPLSRVIVRAESQEAVDVFLQLTWGASATTIAAKLPSDSPSMILELLGLLLASGLIGRVNDPEREELRTWEFHDLLFHRSSRVTDPNREFATFRFRGQIDVPPPFRAPASSVSIRLNKPDMDQLAQSDPPFTKILESRRSKRTPGQLPISLNELAQFLYRTAHVQRIQESDELKRMNRPYPSGGGVHELEFYVAVNRCPPLDPGIYHYRVDDHVLTRLDNTANAAQRVVTRCSLASAMQPHLPDVVVVLTARFPRLFYKYENIGYRLILLHVGVVMQTMYLVATAMGLSPCAIGSGWLRWREQEPDLSWLTEGAVGEFMLSSACEDER